MAHQVSKEMLRRKVEFVRSLGADVELDWAYGQPKLCNGSGSSSISPRASKSVVWNFLDVFEAGFRQGQKSGIVYLGKKLTGG